MSARHNKTEIIQAKDFQNRLPTKPKPLPAWATGKGQPNKSLTQRPAWAAKSNQYDCFVGIDPGVHTGIAITNHLTGVLLELSTLDFWSTTELLRLLFERHGERLLVVIEDPNVHKSLYANKNGVSGEARVRVGQAVGANKREASLLIQFCVRGGIAVEPARPLGKITAADFEQLTGISHGSQHARDAARLILGR